MIDFERVVVVFGGHVLRFCQFFESKLFRTKLLGSSNFFVGPKTFGQGPKTRNRLGKKKGEMKKSQTVKLSPFFQSYLVHMEN
jgi:hypothetical protein